MGTGSAAACVEPRGSCQCEAPVPVVSQALRELSGEELRPVRVLALRSVDGVGGGAESVLLRTAACIDPARVRMTICSIHREGDEAYDFDRRAATLGIAHRAIVQRSILARGVLAELQRTIDELDIDVVDAHDYKAAFFARWLGRPQVATLHGWSGHHWRERLLYYPAERLLARTFPAAVAVSGEIRDVLVRWGVKPDRVRVLLNGIDPDAFRRTPGETRRIRNARSESAPAKWSLAPWAGWNPKNGSMCSWKPLLGSFPAIPSSG